MFIEMAPSCPWVSVLPMEVEKKLNNNQIVALFKLFVKVTEQAVEAYQQGTFAKLDALVGNSGCEVHTFTLLTFAECDALRHEAPRVLEKCRELATLLNTKKVDRDFCISRKMLYLIQSRLLTVTKKFVYNELKFGTDQYEVLETNIGELRKISRIKVDDHHLGEIVAIAQCSMAESSVSFMRARLKDGLVKTMLTGDNLFLYGPSYVSKYTNQRKNCRPKIYSCVYYNTKALLSLINETKTPLVVKQIEKMGKGIVSAVFDGNFCLMAEPQALPRATPVVVCMAFCHEEWLQDVERFGIDKIILAATALEDQYVPKQPELFTIREPEAVMELEAEAQTARTHNFQGMLYVDHFYASTIGENYE